MNAVTFMQEECVQHECHLYSLGFDRMCTTSFKQSTSSLLKSRNAGKLHGCSKGNVNTRLQHSKSAAEDNIKAALLFLTRV